MDLLTEQVQFNTYERGEDIERYLKDLVSFLEDDIYGEIAKRLNRLLKITVDAEGNVSVDGDIVQTTGDYLATDQVRAINGDGLKLCDDDGDGVFVADGGNVGIGTTSPGAKLHIQANTNNNQLKLQRIGTLTGEAWIYVNDDILRFAADNGGNAGHPGLVGIDLTSGNVGIGTTDPKSKLHVVGLPVYANNAAAVAGGLTAGAFYRTGADPDPVCVVH